jgi:hypothetical protein
MGVPRIGGRALPPGGGGRLGDPRRGLVGAVGVSLSGALCAAAFAVQAIALALLGGTFVCGCSVAACQEHAP